VLPLSLSLSLSLSLTHTHTHLLLSLPVLFFSFFSYHEKRLEELKGDTEADTHRLSFFPCCNRITIF
jgi:hypothetical protein